MLKLINTIELPLKISTLLLVFICVVAFPLQKVYGQAVTDIDLKQEGLEKYREEMRREKLFVHTDKNFYLAGELLWFKVYCVNGSNIKSDNLSKVAYLEVLDINNEAVLQAKVALKDGSGHGSWFLPASLSSGSYKLRGYTNWMKNFSPEFYYEEDITIVNSIVPVEPTGAGVAGKKGNASMQFFPEGGKLLAGIDNKVAFRLMGENARGIERNGVLVNQNGDTIASFKPLKFGIGHFSFTPMANTSYKALIRKPGGEVWQQELPRVLESGVGLQLKELGGGKLNIRVQNTSARSRESIYLVVHAQEKVKLAKKAFLNSGVVNFVIDKAAMGDGVNHITIFDNAKSPVSERLYFKQPTRQKLLMELGEAANKEYALRQKVDLNLLVKDQDAKAVAADISVAVYKLDSLQQPDPADIFSYLWLSSELKGEVESPGWYFSSEEPVVQEALDNLMLTHGWRNFSTAADEEQAVVPSFKFLPEYEGHLITGQIVQEVDGNAASNVMVYLSVPGKNYQLYGAKSNASGNLLFNARNYFGEGEIVLQTNSHESGKYKIKIFSPFSKEFSDKPLPKFRIQDRYKDQLLNNSIAMQVQNVYKAEEIRKRPEEEKIFSPYYGGGYDETYLLDNYTRFPTMEEVIREYIKGVRLKRQDGVLNLRAVNQYTELSFEKDPLMLLNGIPVFDSRKILALDPYKLEEVGVGTNIYINGALVSEGVLSLSTYNGDLAEVDLEPEALVLDYEGLQQARKFYAPQYDNPQQKASRLPDFRQVLLWLPEAATAKDGTMQLNFYTSDVAGTYVVIVHGLTRDGKAGSASFLFEAGGAL